MQCRGDIRVLARSNECTEKATALPPESAALATALAKSQSFTLKFLYDGQDVYPDT